MIEQKRDSIFPAIISAAVLIVWLGIVAVGWIYVGAYLPEIIQWCRQWIR